MKKVALKKLIEERIYKYCTLDDLLEMANNSIYDLILNVIDTIDTQIKNCRIDLDDVIFLINDRLSPDHIKYDVAEYTLLTTQKNFITASELFAKSIRDSKDLIKNQLSIIMDTYVSINPDMDLTLLQKNWAIEVKKLDNRLNSNLKSYKLLLVDTLNELNEEITFLANSIKTKSFNTTKYENIKIQSELTASATLDKAVKENKYKKIFDYRDISQLAESLDFTLVRFNGDHAIYKHNITGESLPIPARTIGSGLSYKIQKQLREKSIEPIKESMEKAN